MLYYHRISQTSSVWCEKCMERGGTLNSLQDVADICEKYITIPLNEAEDLQDGVEHSEMREIYREMAVYVREGLMNLKKLKLTRDDRQHLSLIRKSFEKTLKYFDFMAKERYRDAAKEIAEAKLAIDTYRIRKNLIVP